MKNSPLPLMLIAILMIGLNSCSQRYGYLSKVKAPKKQNEAQVAKRNQKPIETNQVQAKVEAIPLEKSFEAEGNQIPNTSTPAVMQPEVKNTSTVLASRTFKKASTAISKYHNPYKNLSGKAVSVFKKNNHRAIASADNMQFGKDMRTVILSAIIGLAAIVLALILSAEIIYVIGSIFLLIALIILILILVDE